MQVETIEMDPQIARVHYLRYRDQVRKHREARKQKLEKKGKEAGRELGRVRIAKSQLEKEDEELKLAYRALSRGERLINVPRALEEGNLNPSNQLPNLAIAKADWKWCYLGYGGDYPGVRGRNYFTFTCCSSRYDAQYTWRAKKNHITFSRDMFPAELSDQRWRRENNLQTLDGCWMNCKALVPTVPPHLRPEDLSKFYILWEAVWEKEPPIDPILLSRVNDRMYAVVAQWDLTDLEQQVLEGRF